MTGATMQLLVKSTNPDFDVSNVTVKFGSRDWNTAYGATKICDPDDLFTASACQAKCTAGTVDDDGWTTCVIDGFGGKDTFDALPYYSYTEEGAQGCKSGSPFTNLCAHCDGWSITDNLYKFSSNVHSGELPR